MFNDFNLNDNEVMKIIKDYNLLILRQSTLINGFEEDLKQEIELEIFRTLTKNRKK